LNLSHSARYGGMYVNPPSAKTTGMSSSSSALSSISWFLRISTLPTNSTKSFTSNCLQKRPGSGTRFLMVDPNGTGEMRTPGYMVCMQRCSVTPHGKIMSACTTVHGAVYIGARATFFSMPMPLSNRALFWPESRYFVNTWIVASALLL